MRELRVVDDLASAAVSLFLEAAPRTLVLAGGSTPRRAYEALADVPYPWGEVDVLFGDERCVPPEHPDSNYGMARSALLRHVAARAHPMLAESSPDGPDAVLCDPARYELELRASFPGSPAPEFDLVFLGLGADGHTASLFAGDPALDIRERWVARVERADHVRLTLTLPVLDAAGIAVFLVAGEAKRAALHRLMDDGPSPIPAARVQARRVVVLADPEAAGSLPPRSG